MAMSAPVHNFGAGSSSCAQVWKFLMTENKSVHGKIRRDRHNNDATKDSEHIVQGEKVYRDYHRYPTKRHVCQLHYDIAEKVGGEYPA